MTWNLIYIRKRTFRRIDERPVYLFHNAFEHEIFQPSALGCDNLRHTQVNIQRGEVPYVTRLIFLAQQELANEG